MQIALHDIRKIGYKKIYESYSGSDIIDVIKNLNTRVYSYDESSFSILNNWGSYEDKISSSYYGFCSLVNNYTPMVSELGADTITKRKFRNTWKKMWTNISKDLGIFEQDINILADCGIRLVYYISEYDSNSLDLELSNALLFYNLLFKWTIFSDKELNFKKNNLDHIGVLEMLALKDAKEFNEFILGKIK